MGRHKAGRAGAGREQELLHWIERVAAFFAEQFGLPPITGRVLGWLLVCEPAGQSAGEIALAIGASRASLTNSVRFLTAAALVRRYTLPGGRTAYYRVDDEIWESVIRRRLASLTSFAAITRDGQALLGGQRSRAARLRAAQQFFEHMAQLLADALAT